MEGFRGGAPAPAAAGVGRKVARWGEDVAREVVRRTLAGESVRGIGRDPAMPAFRTLMKWMKERPAFATAMGEARMATGRRFSGSTGAPSTYCAETAEAIYERLCAGEAMVRICADPDMPAANTVYAWMQRHDDFCEAVIAAREIAADRLAAEGWEMALAATPKTSRTVEVQLRQLRWYAGKLSPRVYGTLKAVEPAEPPERPVVTIVRARSFWLETRADGCRRVRGSYPDPETGKAIDEPPGPWNPPPRSEAEWTAAGFPPS